MCFAHTLKGLWKYSLKIQHNSQAIQCYQNVLIIPNKFNISNNNQEDFHIAYNEARTWNQGGKIFGHVVLKIRELYFFLNSQQHKESSTSNNIF